MGDNYKRIPSVCSGPHLKLEHVLFLTRFRRSKNARPEQDVREIQFLIRIDGLQEQADPPPDHLEGIKILKAEICPNRSIPDIGHRIADAILASYKNAKAVQVGFHLKVKGHFRGNNFYVQKTKTFEKGNDQSHHGRERCEYTCIRSTLVITTIGKRTETVNIYIRSTETQEFADAEVVVPRKEKQSQKVYQKSRLISPASESLPPMFDVLERVIEHTENNSFTDVQALELKLANLAFQKADETTACKLSEVTVRVRVPDSERLGGTRHHTADNPMFQMRSVFVTLQRLEYEKSRRLMKNDQPVAELRRAYVALGSNVGDRLGMIESACLEMNRRGINVARTSAVYETEPMYLQDQNPFINGACEVCIALAWRDFPPDLTSKANLHRRSRQSSGLLSY